MNLQVSPHQADEKRSGRDQGGGGGLLKYLIGGAALVALLGGFYFYTHRDTDNSVRGKGAAPVKVAIAEQRDMAVIERTIGTVVPNATVSVTARVQGQLISTNFKEGQLVKQGDLLFVIDPAPYQAAYDSAVASLASTKAKAERYQRLMGQNAVAPQDQEDAQAAYLQAKANAESARLNLAYTRIYAPVDGKTGPILIQNGNVLMVAGITATVSPLVTINQIQPIKVSFSLPQADLPRIQLRARTKGLQARVLLHDQGGEDLVAPVDFVSNAVNGNSGTIELRATFPNADSALVPGQLVDVVVELADIPDAVVVPREAINTGPAGEYVYTANNKVAVDEPVTLLFDDGTYAAIQGNVKGGDKVIVDGQLRVVPGGKLSIMRAAGAGAKGDKAGKHGEGTAGRGMVRRSADKS